MRNGKPHIFITGRIPEAGRKLLENRVEMHIYDGKLPAPRETLLNGVHKADGILCLVADRIDREVMDNAPNLKIISVHAVGYDNVDVAAAGERGIWVTNTPGVLTDATADLTWALILAVCRRVVEGDGVMRRAEYSVWDPLYMRGAEITGQTLGIVGPGRIGSAVARRSRGWHMNILYTGRTPNRELESELGARKVDLPYLLSSADIVSLHVPLSAETRHLIDGRALKRMKPSAYLINTARGPVVDEAALVSALRTKEIAGAALDVFEDEPRTAPGLTNLRNVVLTPHIGSATYPTRDKMAEIAARNILSWLDGKTPISLVNPEVRQKQ